MREVDNKIEFFFRFFLDVGLFRVFFMKLIDKMEKWSYRLFI